MEHNLGIVDPVAMRDGKILLSAGNRLWLILTQEANLRLQWLSLEAHQMRNIRGNKLALSFLNGSFHFFVSLYAESLRV